jgi:hypothetical protein
MHVTPPPSVLPDISPSRGEIRTPQAARTSLSLQMQKAGLLSISPLEGEMSGRTKGGDRRKIKGQWHVH